MSKKFSLGLLILVLQYGLHSLFVIDNNCFHNSSGASFTLNQNVQIDFYIPFRWTDKENYLLINLDSTNLVLKHPDVEKDSNDINLPLNDMKIGWNTIYIEKDVNFHVVVKTLETNEPKILHSISVTERSAQSLFIYIKGMNSVVNCLKTTRYFLIPGKRNVEIPEVMFNNDDYFRAYSQSYAFSFEITLSGKRRKICEKEISNESNENVAPKDCKHRMLGMVSRDIEYKVMLYPEDFETEDVLNYGRLTFLQYTLHNTGETDFYIQTFLFDQSLKNPETLHSNKEDSGVVKEKGPETLHSNKEDLGIVMEKGESPLLLITVSSVLGIIFVIALIATICLYLNRDKISGQVLLVGKAEDGTPFPEATDPKALGILNRGISESNYYVEHHNKERYPKEKQEVKPELENKDFPGKKENIYICS